MKESVNYMMNKIKEYVNKTKRYIRYLRICDALGIKLLSWQRDFVLDDEPFPEYINADRGVGKTMTVLIRLMLDTDWHTTKPEAIRILMNDKDFVVTSKAKMEYCQDMYDDMRNKCIKKGIKVSKIDFMHLNETKDW